MADIKLSNNFTLAELTRSETAATKGIPNTPNAAEVESLRKLATQVLQPIRDKWGAPIRVNSGFRSLALNNAISGASKTSQHMKAEAADICAYPKSGESQKEANKRLFDLIASMIKAGEVNVGQLIDEYGYKWIHVSLPSATRHNDIRHLG